MQSPLRDYEMSKLTSRSCVVLKKSNPTCLVQQTTPSTSEHYVIVGVVYAVVTFDDAHASLVYLKTLGFQTFQSGTPRQSRGERGESYLLV